MDDLIYCLELLVPKVAEPYVIDMAAVVFATLFAKVLWLASSLLILLIVRCAASFLFLAAFLFVLLPACWKSTPKCLTKALVPSPLLRQLGSNFLSALVVDAVITVLAPSGFQSALWTPRSQLVLTNQQLHLRFAEAFPQWHAR